jgi:hypothetical protein
VWQTLYIRGPSLCETSQVSLQDDCQGIILHGRNRAILVGVWHVLGKVSRWTVAVQWLCACASKPRPEYNAIHLIYAHSLSLCNVDKTSNMFL